MLDRVCHVGKSYFGARIGECSVGVSLPSQLIFDPVPSCPIHYSQAHTQRNADRHTLFEYHSDTIKPSYSTDATGRARTIVYKTLFAIQNTLALDTMKQATHLPYVSYKHANLDSMWLKFLQFSNTVL